MKAGKDNEVAKAGKSNEYVTVIHVEDVHALGNSPAEIMEELCKSHDIPEDKQVRKSWK